MTTAVTEAIGLRIGAAASFPVQSSAAPATMVPVWSVVVMLVGLAAAIGWAPYARAVRVDRLHRQVLGSRATLEAQLAHRAEAAAGLATSSKPICCKRCSTVLPMPFSASRDWVSS